MLVLTRRVQERIFIGETVELVVLEIGGGKVRIGFIAPPEIKIDRSEVREKKDRETSKD